MFAFPLKCPKVNYIAVLCRIACFGQNNNRRFFLFITEPEESDHDYQPVGGTGKLWNINVHTLKFTDFKELTKIYRF
jgi:hypothetical protein